MTKPKLLRSRDRRIIAGVCGGLAEYFEIDVTWVRLGALVASLFSAGIVIALYVVAWLTLPDQASGETGADQIYDRYGDYRRLRDERANRQDAQSQPTDSFNADA